MPIQPSRAGCCIGINDWIGHPRGCPGHVVYAGRWRDPTSGDVWRVFLCAEHRDQAAAVVTDLRPLTDSDRTALQLRQERHAAALRGERWIPPRPLSEGRRERPA